MLGFLSALFVIATPSMDEILSPLEAHLETEYKNAVRQEFEEGKSPPYAAISEAFSDYYFSLARHGMPATDEFQARHLKFLWGLAQWSIQYDLEGRSLVVGDLIYAINSILVTSPQVAPQINMIDAFDYPDGYLKPVKKFQDAPWFKPNSIRSRILEWIARFEISAKESKLSPPELEGYYIRLMAVVQRIVAEKEIDLRLLEASQKIMSRIPAEAIEKAIDLRIDSQDRAVKGIAQLHPLAIVVDPGIDRTIRAKLRDLQIRRLQGKIDSENDRIKQALLRLKLVCTKAIQSIAE